MTRYIDADKLLEEVKRSGHALSEWSTLGVCAVIGRQPTADVVPKSEYDELKELLDATIAGQETLQEALAKVKSEAEKIFEEMEDRIEVSTLCSLDIDEVKGIIAELKKKYTEGSNGRGQSKDN